MVKGAINSFTSHEDLERFKKFFQDKGKRWVLQDEFISSADIKKCKLAVHQSFDAIQAAADWLSRDSKDVEQVCFRHDPTLTWVHR